MCCPQTDMHGDGGDECAETRKKLKEALEKIKLLEEELKETKRKLE